MVIVGFPDAAVKDSRVRMVTALGHFDVDVTASRLWSTSLLLRKRKTDLAIGLCFQGAQYDKGGDPI